MRYLDYASSIVGDFITKLFIRNLDQLQLEVDGLIEEIIGRETHW